MVKKLFEENDIICGTDTWRDRRIEILSRDDKFSEHSFLAKRHTKTGRPSGGTSLFIKNDANAFGSIECQDSSYTLRAANRTTGKFAFCRRPHHRQKEGVIFAACQATF